MLPAKKVYLAFVPYPTEVSTPPSVTGTPCAEAFEEGGAIPAAGPPSLAPGAAHARPNQGLVSPTARRGGYHRSEWCRCY
eukprot:1904998-Pyramimonas_sp.AAC.1